MKRPIMDGKKSVHDAHNFQTHFESFSSSSFCCFRPIVNWCSIRLQCGSRCDRRWLLWGQRWSMLYFMSCSLSRVLELLLGMYLCVVHTCTVGKKIRCVDPSYLWCVIAFSCPRQINQRRYDKFESFYVMMFLKEGGQKTNTKNTIILL